MNITEHEVDDYPFPRQCRICGARIEENDDWVFEESDEDTAYFHATCA